MRSTPIINNSAREPAAVRASCVPGSSVLKSPFSERGDGLAAFFESGFGRFVVHDLFASGRPSSQTLPATQSRAEDHGFPLFTSSKRCEPLSYLVHIAVLLFSQGEAGLATEWPEARIPPTAPLG